MPQKYTVNLSSEEQQRLIALTRKGKIASRMLRRAQILLLADEGHPDETIAQMLHVGESTVHHTRQRCVLEGVEAALTDCPRVGGKRKLDGQAEAFLVATACSEPPLGKAEWTMQLLADRLVELQLVESISDETVRRYLQNIRSSRGLSSKGVLVR